jgi:arylsulfatase A-like enzyme
MAGLVLVGSAAYAAPPNILLIIADDMGLDASPCYAMVSDKPRMPHLERLCREGLVFENAYAAPMCSPTRATILTGRYGFRTGVGTAVGRRSEHGLKPSETTLFQFLDRHAPEKYTHGVIGKWHLAAANNGGVDHPEKAGVGYYAGVLSGTIRDYYSWPRTHNGETTTIDRYITTSLTDEAMGWIGKQKDRPWFLWLAHVAPHLPLHLPPKALHTRHHLDPQPPARRRGGTEYYLAALEALDSEMGRLFATIPKNTIVIFIGDNGTPNQTVQDPFSRGRAKASVFEGGTHVPIIVWGAGVTRKGQREKRLVNSTDLFATIAELAGIEHTMATKWPEDSISFKSYLASPSGERRDFAYVEHFGPTGEASNSRRQRRRARQYGWAIRDERWRYVTGARHGEQFFDLHADPYEQNDLLSGDLSTNAKAAFDVLVSRGRKLRDGAR